MEHYTATYSPDDNKLRLYSISRLDADTYAKVKTLGFRWAPKQELFVAPMWTPQREDLLIEMCGSIGDEDSTLADRAEVRADRFGDYSDKRAVDAESASTQADNIGERFSGGQPILVGHHSEKKARKDHSRMENAMRKSIKMWETSEYWKYRAAGALANAQYKERPEVRARRIKKIEAARRKDQKYINEALDSLGSWEAVNTPAMALHIANYSNISKKFYLSEYPREKPASQYEGSMGLWSALDSKVIDWRQAKDIALKHYPPNIAWYERWINHYDNRLVYEKAMLDDQGGMDLLEPKPRPKQLPICNYKQKEFVLPNEYCRNQTITYRQIDMTKAEYSKVYSRHTRPVDNSHRIRVAGISREWVSVFLTDSKRHPKPAPVEPEPPKTPERIARPIPQEEPEIDKAEEMRKKLEAVPEIQVTYADQFYPTPDWLADKMVDCAEITDNLTVLEPSAGGGAILSAINHPVDSITAVELDNQLFNDLAVHGNADTVVNQDFLTCNGGLGEFDRVIMNPPFKNAVDIKHIKHALTFLKPGGKLVAICANGPRQKDQLEPLADYWEELPEDTFKEAGTGVRTVLLTMTKGLDNERG